MSKSISTDSSIRIIAHRGLWSSLEEQNTAMSFRLAFNSGFGVETDIRDCGSEIIIAHDAFHNGKALTLSEFFEIYRETGSSETLALNIKADGLSIALKELLAKYHIENYFLFDMSIPETLKVIRHGLKFYSRISQYELADSFADSSLGIWLDDFKNDLSLATSLNAIPREKKICMVSPELHGFNNFQEKWSLMSSLKRNGLSLCTDKCHLAREFFYR